MRFGAPGHEEGSIAVGSWGWGPERLLYPNYISLETDLPRGHAWLLRSMELVLQESLGGGSLPLVTFMSLFRCGRLSHSLDF